MVSEREPKIQRWCGECKRMIICLHAAEAHQDAKKPLLLAAVFGIGMR
jgi:hypothetical protein